MSTRRRLCFQPLLSTISLMRLCVLLLFDSVIYIVNYYWKTELVFLKFLCSELCLVDSLVLHH